MEVTDKVIEKFWIFTEQTNYCWNWSGPLSKSGLPIIRVSHDEYSSRRVSLFLSGKELLPSEMAQPLICKNKLCVNPEHLCLGDQARFFAKVVKLSEESGGCWVWTASQDKDMYGKFRLFVDGKKINVRAHQYSWELFTGRPVPPGILVCHKCDHPYCVNPYHLFLGTNDDNIQDMISKGRHTHGEKCTYAKLTDQQVIEIRSLYPQWTQVKLAEKFGVARTTIFSIIHRIRWKHVP